MSRRVGHLPPKVGALLHYDIDGSVYFVHEVHSPSDVRVKRAWPVDDDRPPFTANLSAMTLLCDNVDNEPPHPLHDVPVGVLL